MPGLIKSIARTSRTIQRPYSSYNEYATLSSVDRIVSTFTTVDLTEFRKRAFIPEKPLLITTKTSAAEKVEKAIWLDQSIPAARKWFSQEPGNDSSRGFALSETYLSRFQNIILPYELVLDPNGDALQSYINWVQTDNNGSQELATFLAQLLSESKSRAFHRFHAPLSLFLQACKATPPHIEQPRLYIAQAQIADLPKELQDDLPTPRMVTEAGKGDIYDANIWMGIPPTDTPLHKDPNPNLFVQLTSSKRVRLFEPAAGSAIFRGVQQRIGQHGSASFRGDEMMEGPERDALEEAIWGDEMRGDGYEAMVSRGDALFIPKGWWHSIKSVGSDISCSVNWWFR